MKTKTNARIFAWLLSICLIAGILPAMPANYAQAADILTYDFKAFANSVSEVSTNGYLYLTSDWKVNASQTVTGEDFPKVSSYTIAQSIGSEPFELYYAYKDGGRYAGLWKNLGLALNTDPNGTGSAIRMNLKVKESGWYTLSSDVNNGTSTSFTGLNLALYPNTENTIENVTPIFDCASSAFYTNNRTTTYNGNKAVYLNKDYTYVAEFSAKGGYEGSKNGNIYIYNLIATPAAAPTLAASGNVNTEYTVGDSATTVSYTVGGAAPSSVSAVSDNVAVEVSTDGSAVTFTPVSAGTANVTITANYMGGTFEKVYTITVNPKPLPVNADKFGVHGAYITEENGTYKVTFLSAIDSLDYKNVGFKVTVNGVAQEISEVANVYSSVAVNSDAKGDETVNVASFGLENGFVFLDSIENIEEGATVTFQPYAVDLDENLIEGKIFTAIIQ